MSVWILLDCDDLEVVFSSYNEKDCYKYYCETLLDAYIMANLDHDVFEELGVNNLSELWDESKFGIMDDWMQESPSVHRVIEVSLPNREE